jgi:CNT family concentrative nucleoside transporter
LGDKVTQFLDYTDYGASLVFGDNFKDHFFAFKVDYLNFVLIKLSVLFFFLIIKCLQVMPVIIFFSAVVNILYYFKVIQYLLIKFGWIVHILMGTYPLESANSIATVVLGPGETPILMKPFFANMMTDSELFAFMVSMFSTIAGSLLAG